MKGAFYYADSLEFCAVGAGILGEIQLGAILEQILSPEQYEMNIATKPQSRDVVEFAIKLPGTDDGFVYLPIDSKFPADVYSNLMDAFEVARYSGKCTFRRKVYE